MPIFEITKDAISRVAETTFQAEEILERKDLQRVLRDNIDAIAPNCFVLAEEYGNWADSKRRIDLLCLDSDANLVVVELKRTEDGGHADLQAIRYAAMISIMRFEDAVKAHISSFQKSEDEARQAILNFLKWENPSDGQFAQDVRIILVSADFNPEITSTAIWLNKKDLDVRCVRLKPYKIADRVLVDIQQIIPLPEATDYQNQLKKKEEEERQSRAAGSKKEDFRFSMLNIRPSTILSLRLNNQTKATRTVIDDQTVMFRDKPMSLSRSAADVMEENNRARTVAGTVYWGIEKDGKWSSLKELREQAEREKSSDWTSGQVAATEPAA